MIYILYWVERLPEVYINADARVCSVQLCMPSSLRCLGHCAIFAPFLLPAVKSMYTQIARLLRSNIELNLMTLDWYLNDVNPGNIDIRPCWVIASHKELQALIGQAESQTDV